MEKEINGKKFDIRALTRGERKELRKSGFVLANLSPENAEEAMDSVLDTVCAGQLAQVDALPNPDALELFRAIVNLTYGQGAAEKNSQTSGDGTKATDPPDAKAA